jgi:hypothetical protein
MNCPQCRAELEPDAAYCRYCGTRLAPAASRPAGSIQPAGLDLSRLTTGDKVVAGATLITMISIWLPWFTGSASLGGVTSSASVSGTGYHGWLWLEFIVALLLLAYLAARALWETPPLRVPVAHAQLLIAGTGLQFLLILIAFFDGPSNTVYDGIMITFALSTGAFLGLIFSIVAVGPAIVPAVRSYLESRNAPGSSRSFQGIRRLWIAASRKSPEGTERG